MVNVMKLLPDGSDEFFDLPQEKADDRAGIVKQLFDMGIMDTLAASVDAHPADELVYTWCTLALVFVLQQGGGKGVVFVPRSNLTTSPLHFTCS